MMTLLQALRIVPYTPCSKPAVVFLKVPTIDFKSVESKLFINSIPQFLMHFWGDWCFLTVQIWTYWEKKNQHFRSQHCLARIFFIYFFIVSIYHAQPCVISNHKRSLMKLHYIVLCFVLYMWHKFIYLQKVKSIKVWDAWRIIRPSHTIIWLENCWTWFSR